MKTVSLGYNDVHQLEQSRRNMFWDGWTLVIVDKRGDGWMRRDGMFYNDAWSTHRRIEVDSDGRWRIPVKYA